MLDKDILITGKAGFIGSRIKGGTAFEGTILDKLALLIQANRKHGIVHLAAISGRKACEDNIEGCIQCNLIGLINVLDIALLKDIWVIFASTYQVRDRHIYGLTKLLGEEICLTYQKKGLRIKILRFPIVYGPKDKPWKIVTKFISEIEQGKSPQITTEDKFYFLFVDDVAKIIEQEADILECKPKQKYSLHELEAGIKKCLKEVKK
jgi:nucleoside-diphosphate-sugar epimerase